MRIETVCQFYLTKRTLKQFQLSSSAHGVEADVHERYPFYFRSSRYTTGMGAQLLTAARAGLRSATSNADMIAENLAATISRMPGWVKT